jgi:hypothetical protein
VNVEHFKAFLWLRWRLIANRNKRAGAASVVLQGIFMAAMASLGVMTFVIGILLGIWVFGRATPANFMLGWDVIVVAFLLFWMGELLAELQRSELLSLEKFLHLPVSLSSAFLINYAGSLAGFATIIFLPLMIGVAIGVVASKGLGMLVLFPLLLGFWLMVTALTHQLRGWLASLMVNQRRRRTVITMATFLFILVVQLPSIVNFTSGRWGRRPGTAISQANQKEIERLDQALANREITREEHARQVRPLREPSRAEDRQNLERTLNTVNTYVPLGWLPLGAAAGFEGRAGRALLATAGLMLIGAGSLRRSYKTTLRLYTGQYGARSPAKAEALAKSRESETGAAARTPAATGKATKRYPAAFVERNIRWVSEHAAAIAVTGFRGLTRAPEAKFMLLSPLVMIFIFGGSMFRQQANPPEFVRPLIAAGSFTFMLFMLVGMIGNQFAFDRSGFRTFVLSPAPRRDILLGKNLATAPFAITFMFIGAIAMQLAYPMRVDHFLALLLQMVPMYLIFSLLGNILSILAPMPVAAGSMKPLKPKATTIFIHMGFMFLMPVALAPTLIPLGIEFMLSQSGWLPWFPAYLLLTIVEVVLAVWFYSWLITGQGRLLQRREQRILETVTTKME